MDFEFSPEQEMLRDSVRGFLATRAPLASVRADYDRPAPDPAVWDGLVELGVIGLLVDESHGGAGMGMVDAAVVLEELGRAVCPAPYASSAIGAVALADAELRAAARRRFGDRHARDLRSRSSLRMAHPADAGNPRRPRRLGPRRREGARRRRERGRNRARDRARRRRPARRVRDRSTSLPTRTPTVDGSRKQGRVTLAGAPARRIALDDAPTAVGSAARPLGRRGGRRRRRRRAARARARRRVREGARAVRQADRRVPGGATPLRRHAAHGRARPRRGLLRVLGARRRVTRGGAPRRRPSRTRSRPTRSRNSAGPRSRCSAASASRGSTTSTCTTSAC